MASEHRNHYFTDHTGAKYRVRLGVNHGQSAGQTRIFMHYTFHRWDAEPDGWVPLLSGDDYGPAPTIEPLSRRSAWELLAFLTMQPGDTEDSFFSGYSPEARAWAASYAWRR